MNAVLDTNIVLDLFVFNNPAVASVHAALQDGQLHWLATHPMRDELGRVLTYPKIVKNLNHYKVLPLQVLQQFDSWVQCVAVAPKAPVHCADPDDQKFIDLAVAHQAALLSKDHAVLCMKKRLLALGVTVQAAIESVASRRP
jgi:putative PIN family toxin of toxin-antitoxin system